MSKIWKDREMWKKNGEKEQGGRRSGKRKDKEQTRKKERAWKNIHVNFL